jgi:hypothetical protein
MTTPFFFNIKINNTLFFPLIATTKISFQEDYHQNTTHMQQNSVAPDIAAALKIKVYHGKNGFLASYSLMGNSLV